MTSRFNDELAALVERLEAALIDAEAIAQEASDELLIASFAQGTFRSGELDALYLAIERPFRTTFVHSAASIIRNGGGGFYADRDITDPLYRAVMSLVIDHVEVPRDFTPFDLRDLKQLEIEHAGTQYGALVGLVHRLIQDWGIDALLCLSLIFKGFIDDTLAHGIPPPVNPNYDVATDAEIERYLRLVAPINRRHPIAILMFLSPSGHPTAPGSFVPWRSP